MSRLPLLLMIGCAGPSGPTFTAPGRYDTDSGAAPSLSFELPEQAVPSPVTLSGVVQDPDQPAQTLVLTLNGDRAGRLWRGNPAANGRWIWQGRLAQGAHELDVRAVDAEGHEVVVRGTLLVSVNDTGQITDTDTDVDADSDVDVDVDVDTDADADVDTGWPVDSWGWASGETGQWPPWPTGETGLWPPWPTGDSGWWWPPTGDTADTGGWIFPSGGTGWGPGPDTGGGPRPDTAVGPRPDTGMSPGGGPGMP